MLTRDFRSAAAEELNGLVDDGHEPLAAGYVSYPEGSVDSPFPDTNVQFSLLVSEKGGVLRALIGQADWAYSQAPDRKTLQVDDVAEKKMNDHPTLGSGIFYRVIVPENVAGVTPAEYLVSKPATPVVSVIGSIAIASKA